MPAQWVVKRQEFSPTGTAKGQSSSSAAKLIFKFGEIIDLKSFLVEIDHGLKNMLQWVLGSPASSPRGQDLTWLVHLVKWG